MKRHSLAGIFLTSVIIFISVMYASVAFPYSYEVIIITPPDGCEHSRALGINNAGQVVGRFYQCDTTPEQRAFLWDGTNGARLLPTLSGDSSAWGINDHGLVAGYSSNEDEDDRAVWWDTMNGVITDIGALTNAESGISAQSSAAYDISNTGEVIGDSDIPSTDMPDGDMSEEEEGSLIFHGFLYDETGGIRDVGTLATALPELQNGYSIAYGINDNGDSVGTALGSSFIYVPYIFNENTGMEELMKDPLYEYYEWAAVAINNSGLIGGHVVYAKNQSFPYYWENKSSSPVRVPLSEGFPYGEIYGANASGHMVGIQWYNSPDGPVEHALIFEPGQGVRDLNDLINPDTGLVLSFARDINDAGQIVGTGYSNGVRRGFILSPVYTLTVSGSGNGSGTVTGNGIACDIVDGNAGGDCSEQYALGTSVTVTVSAGTAAAFTGWSGACSGTDVCTVTLDSDTSLTAEFNDIYSIDGIVRTENRLPLAGVTITLSGDASGTTVTDERGRFNFPEVINGSYVVTPEKTGYSFVPENSPVVISDANVRQKFIGKVAGSSGGETGRILGKIMTTDRIPLENVLIVLSGDASQTTTTDSSGRYSFTGLGRGTYTITPAINGYVFIPGSKTGTLTDGGRLKSNFKAKQQL